MRAVSRSPWPASDRASGGASPRRAASIDDTSCGTWDTSATERSCMGAVISMGTPPTSEARARTASTASGLDPPWATTTQGRP